MLGRTAWHVPFTGASCAAIRQLPKSSALAAHAECKHSGSVAPEQATGWTQCTWGPLSLVSSQTVGCRPVQTRAPVMNTGQHTDRRCPVGRTVHDLVQAAMQSLHWNAAVAACPAEAHACARNSGRAVPAGWARLGSMAASQHPADWGSDWQPRFPSRVLSRLPPPCCAGITCRDPVGCLVQPLLVAVCCVAARYTAASRLVCALWPSPTSLNRQRNKEHCKATGYGSPAPRAPSHQRQWRQLLRAPPLPPPQH